ncbi:hypothetical protein HMN09_00956400 [Mycena chlorophos]|uniref:DUF2235 domain-containing protein n=1 Tax=Mycena chlorophos TaxID=658473 RepID=A0A8H6W2P1_MYCCL|nr:hypothetical protein HMN09_00956400 [Mycena chlorophos]
MSDASSSSSRGPQPSVTVESPVELVDQRDVLPTATYIPTPDPSKPSTQRNLILCFDGTGDSFDADNSNIVQLVSALQKDKSKQMVYYQSGIGTYTSKRSATPLATKISLMFDAAIAWNLDSHVMSGYEFLMQNYVPGDKIHIFGFSRGAYIARSLAGMLHKVGLLPASNHQQVPFAYKMYTRADRTGWAQSNAFKRSFCTEVTIDFIGVFDTVDSVGLIPRRLPFTTSNTIIRTFRHAVSLDEHRSKFKANLWNWPSDYEKKLGTQPSQPPTPQLTMRKMQVRGYSLPMPSLRFRDPEKEFDEDVEQAKFESEFTNSSGLRKTKRTDVVEVWFAGCHCDVGGGSVPNDTKNSLARIPLRWMIRECFKAETGIIFDAQRLIDLGLDPDTLYPHVRPRPPPIQVVSADPNMRIARRPPHKTWFQRVFHPRVAKSDAALFAAAEQQHAYPGMEEVEDLKDGLSPIYDQLHLSPGWWILEIIPFSFRTQNLDDTWDTHFRSNLGRAREIPHQLLNVIPTPPSGLPATEQATKGREVVNLKVHRRQLFHSSSAVLRFGLAERQTISRDPPPRRSSSPPRSQPDLSLRRRSRDPEERRGKWGTDRDHPIPSPRTSNPLRKPQPVTFYDPPPDLTRAGVPIVANADRTTGETTDSYSPAAQTRNNDLPRKFTSPPLLPGLQQALVDLFGPQAEPTPIQALSLKWVVEPWMPKKEDEKETAVSTEVREAYKEVLLAAETGSGKSIAYLLPMLQALKLSDTRITTSKSVYAPRALVLAPTHELARQVSSAAKMLLHAPDTRLRVLCASRANTAPRDAKLDGRHKQNATASSMKAAMMSFMHDGPGEFGVGDPTNAATVNPVDVLVGTPMKVMEMVRGRGWDRDAELGKELSSLRESATDKGPKLRRGRDSLPGVGTWRSSPELDLSTIEWVVVDEADVLYDADFQETTRLLLADISRARGHEVPFAAIPVGLVPSSEKTKQLVLAKKSAPSVITPLKYPFHLIFTSATIPNSLSTYLNAYHPGLMRLVSPNIHHLPKSIRTEYVNWTGGNKHADIERRLRQVWAADAAQGFGPGPNCLGPMSKVLVFCNRNTKVAALGAYLEEKGIKNVQLSSGSETRQRGNNKHLNGFLRARPSSSSSSEPESAVAAVEPAPVNDPMHVPHVMITTSLLSRGLDFSPLIKHVFIIEEPRNMIDFLHRAGRTGRGGAKGTVVLFGKMKGRGSERTREARKRVKQLRR